MLLTSCKLGTYDGLKKKIKSNTFKVGGVLTAFYGTTHGLEGGVSAAFGLATALTYTHFLARHVDNFEKHNSLHMGIPLTAALAEVLWNQTQGDGFHLDYGVTLVTFLSYQIALFFILMDEVF